MLLLHSKNVDVHELSKILVKHRISAKVNANSIYIDGELSDSLFSDLAKTVNILSVQNYDEPRDITDLKKNRRPESFNIKRGQIYLCDLGEISGHEQAGVRPFIIMQNNIANKHSDTTVGIPLTSSIRKITLPCNFAFSFKDDILSHCSNKLVFSTDISVALIDQIRVIDKEHILKYLGTFTPEFMEELSKKAMEFLVLQPKSDIKVNDDSICSVEYDAPNEIQKEMLELINKDDCYMICSSNIDNYKKIERLLKAFGFDPVRRGVDLLTHAINESLKVSTFNLETLSNNIAKSKNDITSSEVQRLIVARVKERFSFKKSPTIDFIRLINSLIQSKGEILYE